MPTLTAAAALTTSFTLDAVSKFRPYGEGILDPQTGSIKPTGSGTWSALTGRSWSTWNNFQLTQSQIKWTSNLIDVGEVKYFNLSITSDFDGSLYYMVHTSSTGLFAGEESEYLIEDGNLDIDAFYGRYVYVTAFVTGKEFRSMVITASSETSTVTLTDVDTSTLSGSISARTIALPAAISRCINLIISPKTVTAYPVDLYVSSSATSELVIPMVISKADAQPYFVTDYIAIDYFLAGSTPSFVLYGIDNQPRDGIVDITIKALPRQAMTSGNLVVFN